MVEDKVAFLETKDVRYEIVPFEESELEKAGYEKLPRKIFEKVNLAFQNVPGQLAQKATEVTAEKAAEEMTKNAYRVVLKDGMHLAKSKTLDGAYKGLLFDSNNNLKTQADWIPISLDGSVVSSAPQLALGVFNAMSIVTGQYFLSQINNKLDNLETGLSEIMSYLQAEKRSEIMANDMILMDIFTNLTHILENDLERKTTAVDLKLIKRQSLSNLLLFKSKVESAKDRLKINSKSKREDLEEVFQSLNSDIPQYWCAVRSYINSSVLETIIAEMDSPEYIDNVKKDLFEKASVYENTLFSVDKQIRAFINKVNDLNRKKKIPGVVKDLANFVPAMNILGVAIKVAAYGAVEIDKHIEKSSRENKKQALKDRDEFWTACLNLTPLEESTQLLEDYKISRNSPVDLICTDEKAYIIYGGLLAEDI